MTKPPTTFVEARPPEGFAVRKAVRALAQLGGATSELAYLAELDEWDRRNWSESGEEPASDTRVVSDGFVAAVKEAYHGWLTDIDASQEAMAAVSVKAAEVWDDRAWHAKARLAHDDLRRAAHPINVGREARSIIREPSARRAEELRKRMGPLDRLREHLQAVERLIDDGSVTLEFSRAELVAIAEISGSSFDSVRRAAGIEAGKGPYSATQIGKLIRTAEGNRRAPKQAQAAVAWTKLLGA